MQLVTRYGDVRRRAATIEQADGVRAAAERPGPDLDVAVLLHAMRLPSERILIDRDHFTIGENSQKEPDVVVSRDQSAAAPLAGEP